MTDKLEEVVLELPDKNQESPDQVNKIQTDQQPDFKISIDGELLGFQELLNFIQVTLVKCDKMLFVFAALISIVGTLISIWYKYDYDWLMFLAYALNWISIPIIATYRYIFSEIKTSMDKVIIVRNMEIRNALGQKDLLNQVNTFMNNLYQVVKTPQPNNRRLIANQNKQTIEPINTVPANLDLYTKATINANGEPLGKPESEPEALNNPFGKAAIDRNREQNKTSPETTNIPAQLPNNLPEKVLHENPKRPSKPLTLTITSRTDHNNDTSNAPEEEKPIDKRLHKIKISREDSPKKRSISLTLITTENLPPEMQFFPSTNNQPTRISPTGTDTPKNPARMSGSPKLSNASATVVLPDSKNLDQNSKDLPKKTITSHDERRKPMTIQTIIEEAKKNKRSPRETRLSVVTKLCIEQQTITAPNSASDKNSKLASSPNSQKNTLTPEKPTGKYMTFMIKNSPPPPPSKANLQANSKNNEK